MQLINPKQIFSVSNQSDWMVSHAANPVAIPKNHSGEYRIFFNTRNHKNQSHIAYIDWQINQPAEILHVSERPVLSPGKLGLFDDDGVSLGNIIKVGDQYYLYYVGWNLGVSVPWRNTIGLAICDDIFCDAPVFKKHSQAPILERNNCDPYSLSYPFVLSDKGKFKMWYGSNLNWCKNLNDMQHAIKYAESSDGIHWTRNDVIAIPPALPEYPAMSKPFVSKQANGDYHMWYAIKSTHYEIAVAESRNGIDWTLGKIFSPFIDTAWANEMIAYPYFIEYAGKQYLLFCGNQYGRSGFGIAAISN